MHRYTPEGIFLATVTAISLIALPGCSSGGGSSPDSGASRGKPSATAKVPEKPVSKFDVIGTIAARCKFNGHSYIDPSYGGPSAAGVPYEGPIERGEPVFRGDPGKNDPSVPVPKGYVQRGGGWLRLGQEKSNNDCTIVP